MEFWLLVIASVCFFVSFCYTVYALRAGVFRPGRFNLVAILVGFAFLTSYLYFRGQEVGACPVNTLSDVLVFLGWAIVLIYLVIGTSYRLSLLGAFTEPLVFFLLVVGYFMRSAATVSGRSPQAWVELHAALSLVAYGAFGLAAVAGAMYLMQERQLKRHKVSILFYNLPPIQALSLANGRLLVFGFCLLSVAFVAGVLSKLPVSPLKIWAALIIWAFYGLLVLKRQRREISPRRLAIWSLLIFLLVVISLPGVQYLSSLGGKP